MTTINKFGNMLLELRDPATPQARLEEISRLFNEFSDREEKYRNLLETSGHRFIQALHLGRGSIVPDGTVLSPFVASKDYNSTDVDITNNTNTYVTFNDNLYGNNNIFQLDPDNQKVHILSRAKAFFANVAHAWEANTTGMRRVQFEYYTGADSLIGTALLAVVPTAGGTDETWFTNGRVADLPDQTDYIKCVVKQTSGGNLHLVYFALDLHLV